MALVLVEQLLLAPTPEAVSGPGWVRSSRVVNFGATGERLRKTMIHWRLGPVWIRAFSRRTKQYN